MRILYCNLLTKSNFSGHKRFDVEWVNLLHNIANITLLWPEKDWYTGVDAGINNVVVNVDDEIKKRDFLKWKIWKKEPLKHLAIHNRMEAAVQIKVAIELDKKKPFDYIIISSLDWLSFAPYIKRFRNLERLFLISHSVEWYNKKLISPVFNRIKNKVNFIVMESDGIDFMRDRYSIDQDRIHYIPHILEPVNKNKIRSSIRVRDVVGISNSNSDTEITKIIDLEKRTSFFKKHNIKAIFRSVGIEYDSEYLTVFAGRLGLPYDDYLAYCINAKVMILPFSNDFGIRSSGTLIDAFSQNIPILGNPFATMLQYHKKHPHICMTYNDMDEFQNRLLEILNRKESYEEEFESFHLEHSNDFILKCFKETFI